jgi:hypothetical protein
MTGAGLKESKDAVEALMAGNSVEVTVINASGSGVDPQIVELVRRGQKIAAIQLLRQQTGMGLQEAKQAVDAIEAAHTWGNALADLAPGASIPVVTHIPATGRPAKPSALGSCLGWLIVLGIAAAIIIPILGSLAAFLPLGMMMDQILPLIGGEEGLPNPFSTSAPLATLAPTATPGPAILLQLGGEGTGPGKFKDGRAISVDRNSGNIYVAEYSGGRIQVFDPTGKFLNQWYVSDDKDTLIFSVSANRQGKLYVVAGSELYQYDGMSGERLESLQHPDGWGYDSAIVGADGKIIATWYKNRDDLIQFSSNGKVDWLVKESIRSVTGDNEMSAYPAVAGDGTIYILGRFSGSVFIYSSDGKYKNFFGSVGDEPGQFRAPGAIAVDSQSRVYVSDSSGIMVYAPDGRYLYTIDPPFYAYGMAFDDQDNLYLTTNQNTVYKLAPWEP